jgi:hypothetical protein
VTSLSVGRALGLHHQTVQRCVERAVAEGALAALDDLPRPGREPTITLEAKAWLVSLACRKPSLLRVLDLIRSAEVFERTASVIRTTRACIPLRAPGGRWPSMSAVFEEKKPTQPFRRRGGKVHFCEL